MKSNTVVLITILTYDNLGVGYLAALLTENGFKTEIIDFRKKRSEILKILKLLDPLLIGFSVIFHNYIEEFAGFIRYLRAKGINCHITAGGHYASFRYEELFRLIPELDSIVRFEGEYPLLELVKYLSNGEEWRKTDSLAYNGNDRIVVNPVCPAENDLDKFPFPHRYALKQYAFGRKFTTIIAGRGCAFNCSFCNTREFYLQAGGPVKRIRKPEAVVSEIAYLFHEKDCTVFLFDDDDFPFTNHGKTDWILKFCKELERTGLNKKIIWKINCRPDEIDEERFEMMKRYGLFLVFLGIEDGTDPGLKRLNKQMSVADSLKGINILKKLNISFDYGYILFQPVTTFRILDENLVFLRKICSDGYTPVTFLRLVPLYNTRVEKELSEAGRLKITDSLMEYNFPQESMDKYYEFVMDCFWPWLRSADGVENISKWARNYFSVYFHFNDAASEVIEYHNNLIRIISESNIFLLNTMKELASIFEVRLSNKDNAKVLESFRKNINTGHLHFRTEIINTMAQFMSSAGEQPLKISV